MSYNVLLFDDRPQVRIPLAQTLEEHGMTVYPCRNIYEADDLWAEKKDEVHAIVLDMMMPSAGLEPEDRILTRGGVLTGWFWLLRHLQKEMEMGSVAGKQCDLAKGRCIIIYSAYLEDFREYCIELEDSSEEKLFAYSVMLIDKGNEEFSKPVIDKLLKDSRGSVRTTKVP